MMRLSSCKYAVITGLLVGILPMNGAAVASANETATGLFGSIEISSKNLEALPQWVRVISHFAESKKAAKFCDRDIQNCKSQQMTLWRAKIQELADTDKNTKIREINRFINKWRKVSDQENYNRDDHWATPLEFINLGGDSEDFAIMKYVSLKELGIPPSKMRIVVTNDVLRGTTHSILSVHIGKRKYVLDSQNDTVLQEQFVKYYVPFYSVNETTRWAHIPGQASTFENAGGKRIND